MSTDPGDIRILLAAASPRVQVAAKKVLIEEGYRVVSAVDGQVAADLIAEDPPEIVVTALDLPHVRGPELAAQARAVRPDASIPCLYLVQATDDRAFELTAWDLVLHLPFSATELLARIASLVEARELQSPPSQEVPVHVPKVAWQYDLDHAGEASARPPTPGVDFDLDGPEISETPADPGAPGSPGALPTSLPTAAGTSAQPLPDPGFAEAARRILERLPAAHREGELSQHGLGALLMAAAEVSFTGTLELESGRLKKTIHLRHGRPVFCSSNLLSETLGEYLFRQGAITSGALARSVEQMISDGIQQGEAMVAQGAITRDQLAVALSAHVRRKVVNAFAWNQGDFTFEALAGGRAMLAVEMQPLWLIADAVRLFTAPQDFLHFLDEHIDAYAIPSPHFAEHSGALATIPGGRALLEAIDGLRTVRQMQEVSGLDELILSQLLLSLHRGELISFAPEPAPAAAPAPRQSDAVIGEMEASVFADWGALIDGEQPPTLSDAQRTSRDEVLEAYTALPGGDPFLILGVEPGATAAELALGYEAALSRFAPERFADHPGPEVKRMAGEIYRRVITAYETVRSEAGMAHACAERQEEQSQAARRSGVLHADLRYRWGRELLEEDKPEDALKQFVEAGRRNTDEPIYLLYAGWAGYQSGKLDENMAMMVQGKQRIEKALEMMPVLVEGHLFLAEIARNAKESGDALEHLQRALTLDPNNREVRRLFDKVQRGPSD